MTFNAPHIDYAGLSPVIALTAGICIVLLVGLIPWAGRFTLNYLTIAVLGATAGLDFAMYARQVKSVAAAVKSRRTRLASVAARLLPGIGSLPRG